MADPDQRSRGVEQFDHEVAGRIGPLRLIARQARLHQAAHRGTVRGITVDESTGVTDRAVAEEIRAKREWEIITRQIGGVSWVPSMTQSAALITSRS